MNKKNLATKTSVLRKYYKYVKNSREPEETRLLVAARDLTEKQATLINQSEEDVHPIGAAGALEVIYAISRLINKDHKKDWEVF